MAFKWPGGKKTAVTLTYDDGLMSPLENALPHLDRHGIKATFFPSGGGLTAPGNAPKWKAAVSSGHEIGCHTLNHPCSKSFDFVKKGFSLQDYSIDMMRAEIDENLKIINSFGYKPEKYVFAYPCGESALGEGLKTSYIPLIRGMFTAARGVLWKSAGPESVDLYNVPCFGVECDGKGMIKLVEEARQNGTWAVFLFHGVGGDYISVTTEAHKELAEYLAASRDDIYIERFGTVAEYIRQNR